MKDNNRLKRNAPDLHLGDTVLCISRFSSALTSEFPNNTISEICHDHFPPNLSNMQKTRPINPFDPK